jgi:hypothetical protein
LLVSSAASGEEYNGTAYHERCCKVERFHKMRGCEVWIQSIHQVAGTGSAESGLSFKGYDIICKSARVLARLLSDKPADEKARRIRLSEEGSGMGSGSLSGSVSKSKSKSKSRGKKNSALEVGRLTIVVGSQGGRCQREAISISISMAIPTIIR